jgi:hypothetical protein
VLVSIILDIIITLVSRLHEPPRACGRTPPKRGWGHVHYISYYTRVIFVHYAVYYTIDNTIISNPLSGGVAPQNRGGSFKNVSLLNI